MDRPAPLNSGIRLLACLVVALAAVALPAQKAAAVTYEYCVNNLGPKKNDWGFGVLPVPGEAMSFPAGPASADEACLSTLTVDQSAKTAVLKGDLKQGGNTVAVNLTFTGMDFCRAPLVFGALNVWQNKKPDPDLPNLANETKPEVPSWQCFTKVSGTIGTVAIDNSPARGAVRIKDNPSDVGVFLLSKGPSEQYLLGFKLSFGKVLDPPSEYEVVSCPKNGEDDVGDGSNPDTAGRKDCVWAWFGDKTFTTTVENEPGLLGKVTVVGLYNIEDPRAHCGGNGTLTNGEGYKLALFGLQGAPQGLRIFPTPNTGAIDIPWYLCGITPDTGDATPFIRVVNVEADFERDIVNSVVIHDADGGSYGDPDGPVNQGYECNAATTNTDPVVAWLPRTSELPIYAVSPAGITQKTRVIRDVTTGCGSTRGGSSTRSYLLGNLRYDGGAAGVSDAPSTAQLRSIIAGEISALDITLKQSQVCIDTTAESEAGLFTDWKQDQSAPGYAAAGSSFLAQLKAHYKNGDYELVTQDLEWLLADLVENDRSRLYSGFDTCYYKSSDSKVYNEPTYPGLALSSSPDCNVDHAPGDYCYPPASKGYVPRNFRGDMEAQVRHIIWNIEQKLIPATAP